MKNRTRRSSSQSASRTRSGANASRAKSHRAAIRRATKSTHAAHADTASSVASRRAATQTSGKLDKASAITALKDIGFVVNADGPVNLAEARQVAEGAAASAAQALGVHIIKPDGSIDTQKARDAIGQMLGFSIERDGAGAQAEATQRAQQAAVDAAKALGVDIRDSKGNIDMAKATQVANLALDLKVARAKQLGRREAVDALNTSLKAMTGSKPESRRAASEADKLLFSSVLVDGKISRRKALRDLGSLSSAEGNLSERL